MAELAVRGRADWALRLHASVLCTTLMGKSLPILNIPSLTGSLGVLQQQVTQFFTPKPQGDGPYDGRTVDDFKPYLIALNLTKRCNLKCDHCYLDATTKAAGGDDELSTEECFRLIDQIAEVNKGCLLVITGGEPLVRPDILDIARHAVKLGFMVVFGTNGMLINDQMAKTLVEIGVMGVGISIDSLDAARHNQFRGVPGAWEAAVAGIEASKRNGLQFQIHFSAQPMNYQELPAVIEWAHNLGARVLNVFFMVCTGRGEELATVQGMGAARLERYASGILAVLEETVPAGSRDFHRDLVTGLPPKDG